MSYNTHKRDALNAEMPISHRMSHLRSLTEITSSRYKVNRESVIIRVRELTGLDLHSHLSNDQILAAVECLDALRESGDLPPTSPASQPDFMPQQHSDLSQNPTRPAPVAPPQRPRLSVLDWIFRAFIFIVGGLVLAFFLYMAFIGALLHVISWLFGR